MVMKMRRRAPKRQRRTLHVSEEVSAAALMQDIEKHGRKRCVVVKGAPRFLRTVVIESVEIRDGSNQLVRLAEALREANGIGGTDGS